VIETETKDAIEEEILESVPKTMKTKAESLEVLAALESDGIYSLRLVPSLKQSREQRCYYRGNRC
jgi:hypothetical protein